jgi:predicted RecA/RadA family phage recombinase
MATNIIFEPGDQLSFVCSHPAAPNSGDPVRIGKMTGVALVDEGDGGNIATETTVDIGPFVADISVDDNVGAGIAVGDPLYYHDTGTGTPATSVNNDPAAADAFFGFALAAVAANATTLIRVKHVSPAALYAGENVDAT